MPMPVYVIDAFAAGPFTGNPAAVMPLSRWPEDRVLQSIAAQNNLSETAFFAPDPDGAADFRLRWFTPAVEVDLCGHATLAAGWLVLTRMRPEEREVRFMTASGTLTVRRVGRDGALELDFPARKATRIPMPKGTREALGLRPESFWLATKAMAVLDDPATLRALTPDLAWVKSLPADGLIVTAPGDMDGVDFLSRYFAPHAGIDEDPVTGSAHCTLVPYWAERLGRPRVEAFQASSRGGRLSCSLDGERVRMAGQARLYLEGEAHVDA